eukprot:TRINITY_DN8846_c0_g1_i1.p1 TRINITY_DN8846_c0_g1~~TRINITY_DN8846_c0_g1_i1.p1  ORF type:complete len:548 (+),score=162.57 TRINITY_DN8846_c0_g1_i1:82-1644(+)
MGANMTYLDAPDTAKDLSDGGSLETAGSRHGTCEMQGWRRGMEDAHLSLANFDEGIGLYGVFDGHGGKAVSRFAAKHLPALIKETEAYKRRDYKAALEEAFVTMDVRLRAPEGRKAVCELDQPDPGKKPKPILLPKSLVNRFVAQRSRLAPEEDEEPSGAVDDDDDDAVAGENAADAEAADGAAADTAAADAPAADGGSAAGAEAAAGEQPGVQDTAEEAEDEVRLLSEEEEEGEDDDEAFLDECDEADSQEELVAISPAAFQAEPTPEAQGCTAVVVMLVKNGDAEGPRVLCANAGDSRAVLSRAGAVVALSEDHKPECPVEVARIEAAGGHVQMDAPGGPRVMGDLNLSRAFGDLRYKTPIENPPERQVLTPFPEVRTIPLTDQDEFMVIGCDGIWECLSNQEAVDFVRPRLGKDGKAPNLSAVCAEICDRGLCPSMDANENPSFDGHGCDNMTVTIVQLKADLPENPGSPDDATWRAAAAAEKRAREDARGPDEEAPAAKRPRRQDGGDEEEAPGAA